MLSKMNSLALSLLSHVILQQEGPYQLPGPNRAAPGLQNQELSKPLFFLNAAVCVVQLQANHQINKKRSELILVQCLTSVLKPIC